MAKQHSIITVAGQNKEAAKLAAKQPMIFKQIALGDGTRFPSGGETTLENEVHRGQITGSGVEAAEPNAVWFDLYVPANVNTFYAQEIGLFDEDGLLYAVSRFDQPVPKFGPDSSSLSDNTFRLVVVFSNTENIVVNTSPVAGVTADTLSQHLPFATNVQAADTATLGKIMQVKQAHELFGMHTNETLVGENTEHSPLGVRVAADGQAGIVSLNEIDNRFLVLIRNNPTYPDIQTIDNRLALTDDDAGIIKVNAAQIWVWRGLIKFSVDDFNLADRSFATAANKTYHLRWNAPGTGNATPEASWPNGRFELADLTGATPPETDRIYDSTFDRMLIARVVTDGNNIATITRLSNATSLVVELVLNDTTLSYDSRNSANTHWYPMWNFARRPVLSAVPRSWEYATTGSDLDFDCRITGVNRYNGDVWMKMDFATDLSVTLTGRA